MANNKNFSGTKINRLTAILPSKNRTKDGRAQWVFKCECGKIVEVCRGSVTSGNTKSCGCLKTEKFKAKAEDFKNVRIGSVVGIRRIEGKRRLWEWQCDCGKKDQGYGAAYRHRLKKNGSVGCRHCALERSAKARTKDYTGIRYGHLVAVERIEFDPEKTPKECLWVWDCDCGNTVERTPQIARGNQIDGSCGCMIGSKTKANRTGDRFGSLVALRSVGKKDVDTTYTWEFICDCGNLCQARLRDAVSGQQQSCGCNVGGRDSIKGMIDGAFRNPESNEFAYVFYMKNYPGLIKIGIAWDLDHRSDEEYGELFDFIELPRLDAWLIEQASLYSTRALWDCPDELLSKKWAGSTELRKMNAEMAFKTLKFYHDELLDSGRNAFAADFLPTTPGQKVKLLAAAII
ncbi:hypothetical protein [Synechococcus sp. MIT S1220]|uniref:hypothetical protein n=1 Tax=Synechococcus sp. MIT S1220 TaxID=3082549 RepID=UPI0039B00E94